MKMTILITIVITVFYSDSELLDESKVQIKKKLFRVGAVRIKAARYIIHI